MIVSAKYLTVLYVVVLLMCLAYIPVNLAAEIKLQNKFWQLTVQPDFGARVSSIKSLRHDDFDFVANWEPVEDEKRARGGAFAGVMVGSFTSDRHESGQLNQTYTLEEQAENMVRLQWRHQAPLFKDLVEERTISLSADRPEISVHIRVTNKSEELRVIAYRFQDWIGTGKGPGYEAAYVVPQTRDLVHAFLYQQGVPDHNFSFNPTRPWYAMADLTRDAGLLVQIESGRVLSFLHWLSGSMESNRRTAETYFPMLRLEAGEVWETTIKFTAYNPSSPHEIDSEIASFISAEGIEKLLAAAKIRPVRSGPPMNARMQVQHGDPVLTINPIHPVDGLLGTGNVYDYGGTLQSVKFYATPGERVPMAIAVSARKRINAARFSIGALAGDDTTIEADQFERRFVSTDGYGYLVKDWHLASDLPDDVTGVNNKLVDAGELTPFHLDAGEAASLWALLRIPKDAAPGEYRGEAVIALDTGEQYVFTINLTVYPFTLLQPEQKTYGSFFRYYLRRGDEDEREYAVERETVRKALEGVTELGYNSLFLYGNQEEVLWIVDQCVDLGWQNSMFTTNALGGISTEALKERYEGRNFTFLAWTIDEPRSKEHIAVAVERYQRRIRQGHRPTYTPNSPFALIFAELLEQYVPIVALSVPSFLEVTRRYSEAERDIYWYSASLSSSNNVSRVQERLRRGVYFWKEPVSGILDWGEDTMSSRKGNSAVAGFAGTEVLPRTSRENVAQALIDMRYLYTLERRLEETQDQSLRQEGRELLAWFRSYFAGNPYYEAVMAGDQVYLDRLRGEVADMITKIVRAE